MHYDLNMMEIELFLCLKFDRKSFCLQDVSRGLSCGSLLLFAALRNAFPAVQLPLKHFALRRGRGDCLWRKPIRISKIYFKMNIYIFLIYSLFIGSRKKRCFKKLTIRTSGSE